VELVETVKTLENRFFDDLSLVELNTCNYILYRLRSSTTDEASRQSCCVCPFFCIHNEIFDVVDEVRSSVMNLIAEGWAEEWALREQTMGVAKVIIRQQSTSAESASTATLRTYRF
jgi:hypothetical protein